MREERLPCGCYAEPNGDHELVVTASAFTCDHRQGDVVGPPPEIHPQQETLDVPE